MHRNAFLIAIVLMLTLGASATAQVASDKPDLRQLRRDIRVFAGVMDTMIKDSAPEPFGLLESTKGAYLPGFGLVFTLEINLVQLRQRSPFDARPLSQQELDQAWKLKRERIALLEERLPRVLADYGSNIELPASEHLAVVVHLFTYPEEDPEALPSRLVAQANRSDLVEYKAGRMSLPDFAKRVTTVKF